jgi:hypothetical protein
MGRTIRRQLTSDEERLCDELGVSRLAFLGHGSDYSEFRQADSYCLLSPRPLDSDQPVVVQIEALELTGNLRFGNLMVAMANAYLLASALGVDKVIFPQHSLLRGEFDVSGIKYSQKCESSLNENRITRLQGTYFYSTTLGHLAEDRRSSHLPLHLFSSGFSGVPKFSLCEIGEWIDMKFKELRKAASRDITIHIRSGDIFGSDKPHPKYWQPPLCFYLSVITQVKPRKVTLVIEDRGNPVIQQLVRYLESAEFRFELREGSL